MNMDLQPTFDAIAILERVRDEQDIAVVRSILLRAIIRLENSAREHLTGGK